MIKKTLFLSSIPMMALPAFAIVSCASTTQSPEQQEENELARLAFLTIKAGLSVIAKDWKPNNSVEFEEMIKRLAFTTMVKNAEFKIQTEDKYFIVNYKFLAPSGSFDEFFKDGIVSKTEEFTGSWKFPILALEPDLKPPTDPLETSGAGEFYFLTFKQELVGEASKTPLSNTDAVQSLKNRLLEMFPYNPKSKTGLKSLDIKIEGDFFIFDYELETPKGSIWDNTGQDPSKLPPDRETLKGTIKAAGRKN